MLGFGGLSLEPRVTLFPAPKQIKPLNELELLADGVKAAENRNVAEQGGLKQALILTSV